MGVQISESHNKQNILILTSNNNKVDILGKDSLALKSRPYPYFLQKNSWFLQI